MPEEAGRLPPDEAELSEEEEAAVVVAGEELPVAVEAPVELALPLDDLALEDLALDLVLAAAVEDADSSSSSAEDEDSSSSSSASSSSSSSPSSSARRTYLTVFFSKEDVGNGTSPVPVGTRPVGLTPVAVGPPNPVGKSQ